MTAVKHLRRVECVDFLVAVGGGSCKRACYATSRGGAQPVLPVRDEDSRNFLIGETDFDTGSIPRLNINVAEIAQSEIRNGVRIGEIRVDTVTDQIVPGIDS